MVSYLCAGWDVVASQFCVLMDEPRRNQRDGRMTPQRLVEHGTEVGQLTQVILRDRIVAAHLLDLLVQSILACQRYFVNSLVPARKHHREYGELACISGFLASSYIAHSVVTKVVSAAAMITSHTSIINCSSVNAFSATKKSK
jgi:hypothetical protein